jgi:hypothetical protein
MRGSAIVGFPTKSDPQLIHVFFEGNRYASDTLRRFANRAAQAAGRCRWRQFDPEDWRREHPGDPQPPGDTPGVDRQQRPRGATHCGNRVRTTTPHIHVTPLNTRSEV